MQINSKYAEFQQFLIKERNLTEEQTQETIKIVEDFVHFLEKESERTIENANAVDLERYAPILIDTKKNTDETFIALIRYSSFVKNDSLIIALYELWDGYNVLTSLSDKIREELGEEKWSKIFSDIVIPPLGSQNANRPKITQKLMENFEGAVDAKTCRNLLAKYYLHTGPFSAEYKTKLRKKFLNAKNIDEFLKNKHQEYLQFLEGLMNEKKLYYTQEITPEVLEFVRENPIVTGIREGNKILEIKIPYNTKEYLKASDDIEKRYHYCHCMWAKESIKNQDVNVSPTFCYCSASYHKQYWDSYFDQLVEIEVLENVLEADSLVCKFAITIPENIMKDLEKK
ncbi:MAG: hypothetical protein ACFFDW_07575 [Candidatus Thorarchaeota archaeon]